MGKSFRHKPGHFQATVREPSVPINSYRDGTKSAVYSARGVGWTYAGGIAGRNAPAIVSMLGWPGPFAQYHTANAFENSLVEIMLTRREPHNAERLLLSTGIVSFNMESNWENGRSSPIGSRIETPFMDMAYRTTRGAQFNMGPRPPVVPNMRGLKNRF